MNPEEAFGQAVRNSRVSHGWSQEELASATGLDRTYISGIERGKRNPTLKIICRIASALGVTPSELLDGIQSTTNNPKEI
jgi:transcriptional regulator with XRE-family HTH domain